MFQKNELIKKEIKKLQGQLVNLDATIVLFDPSYRVGSIKPRNPRMKAQVFKHGALCLAVVDILRRAGTPLNTREVLSAVTAGIGEGKGSEAVLRSSVRSTLSYLTRRGSVAKIGKGIGCRWGLNNEVSHG